MGPHCLISASLQYLWNSESSVSGITGITSNRIENIFLILPPRFAGVRIENVNIVSLRYWQKANKSKSPLESVSPSRVNLVEVINTQEH